MFLRNIYYNLTLIIFFLLILLLPTIDNFFHISRHIHSNFNENRKLATFPPLTKENGKFSGGNLKRFPKEFDQYYNDHFGFRTSIITLGNKIFSNNSVGNKNYILGQDDWIFLNELDMVKNTLGLKPLTASQINQVTQNLYHNWQALKAQNIDYLFIIAPNKQTIYPEFLPKYLASILSKKSSINTRTDQILTALLENYPDFPILDLRANLITAKNLDSSKIIYHKTDTHWNGLGMKYGYEAIYENLKQHQIAINKTEFNLEEKLTDKGDLADMSGYFPQYYSSFATVKNPTFKKIENSPITGEIKNKIQNYYQSKRNLENVNLYRNKTSDKMRVYIQHDSFFDENMLQPFLANSFNETLFVKNILENNYLCKIHEENIKYYQPKLVIHEIVERYFIEKC